MEKVISYQSIPSLVNFYQFSDKIKALEVRVAFQILTAAETEEGLDPAQFCQEEVTIFSFPENYEEAEWLLSELLIRNLIS